MEAFLILRQITLEKIAMTLPALPRGSNAIGDASFLYNDYETINATTRGSAPFSCGRDQEFCRIHSRSSSNGLALELGAQWLTSRAGATVA